MDSAIKTMITDNIAGHNSSIIGLFNSSIPLLLRFGFPVALLFFIVLNLMTILKFTRR